MQTFYYYQKMMMGYLLERNYVEARKCAHQAARNASDRISLENLCKICIDVAEEHEHFWFEAIYTYKRMLSLFGEEEGDKDIRETLLEGKKF